jgi:TetR/AcrR family transcriptional regulator, fatty acid metabolism regulator protein
MSGVTANRSLKEKQRAERENLILQAAEEMLAERGYHETSMDEIAQRVGIAKGTLYLHFASKEALVMALFQRNLHGFLQDVDQIVASPLGPRAKLEAILQTIITGGLSKRSQLLVTLAQHPELRKVIFDEKHERLQQIWQQFMGEVSTLLEAGKTTGEFDASLPTGLMLSAFFGLVSPQVHQRVLVDQQMSPEVLAQHLARIYFKGIAAR